MTTPNTEQSFEERLQLIMAEFGIRDNYRRDGSLAELSFTSQMTALANRMASERVAEALQRCMKAGENPSGYDWGHVGGQVANELLRVKPKQDKA